MRHFRDHAEIVDAIAESYRQNGVRVIEREGRRFALFFSDEGKLIAAFDIGLLAATIMRKLS